MAARVIDSITGSQEGRAVAAYLRGPISGGSPWRFNLSNEADVRGGIIHYPLLGNLPSPSDPSASSFGVQQSGAFTAEIVPPARGAQAVQIGAGAYINTPDSAATSPTGSFEIRFKCRAASYANGSFQTIAGKYTEGGAKSWVIYWTAAGTFAVSWSNDGSTIAGAQAMGGVPPSNLPVVIRVLADASNNLWRTEISYDDGLTFAAFGQSNSVTIAVPDIASLLEFGAYSGGLNPFSGVIYWAEVRSGLGGPVQARFDAEDAVSGLTAVTSKLTGEVWTLQGAATLVADSPDGGLSHIDWHDLCRTARGTLWELELVSRIVKPDGSSAEITDTRRATARTVSINKRRLSIRFADVDTAAMDRPFPFNRYTKEAFAKIYEGHIGRVITDCSPGTQIKLPMSYIDNNGSNSYVFAVCEKRSGPTYTVNTVYRDGRIVSASEYSASTATSSGGLVVVTVVFAREQRDTNGRQYEFTADISVSGSREPSGEVQRLLALAGITCDSASFTAAISADAAGSFQIDAAYATERTVRAIVEDLLQVARGWLQKTSNGSWAIVQDKARASALALDERYDLVEIDSVEEPLPPRAYELKYRPRQPGGSDWQFTATRNGSGTAETLRMTNPYIYDGSVADRLIDYISKRENGRRDARIKCYAATLDTAEVLTVFGASAYAGNRDWLVLGIDRPVDANVLACRQYDASIYTYTSGTIPAGATVGYSPDYSLTPPAAPTSLTVVSQGTSINTDGTVQAYALVRAVPPSVNWSQLIFIATNTTTNEVYRAVAALNAGNYEATIAGLRPGRGHNVVAFAINANNIDGAATSAVAFTSADNTGAPSAVSGQVAVQGTGTSIYVSWTPSTITNLREYRVERSVNGGAYSTYRRINASTFVDDNVSFGSAYAYKIYVVDRSANESSAATTGTISVSANLSDTYVITGGINGTSIGNGSINRGRTNTTTGSFTGTVNILAATDVTLEKYSFFPSIKVTFPTIGDTCTVQAVNGGTGDDGRFRLYNPRSGLPANDTATCAIEWRNFLV